MMSFSSPPNMVFIDPFTGEQSTAVHGAGAQPPHAGATYFNNPQAAATLYSTSPMAVNTAQLHQIQPPLVANNPVAAAAAAAATVNAASTGGAVGLDHRRSPSSGRSVSGLDHAQRRATHNAIERARRESLNGQFQDLASAVPSLIHVRRPSKATIVEKSLDYIRSFKDHLGNRDLYIKKLQLRNLALHDEVNRLRQQLGLEPIADAGEPSENLPTLDDIVTGKADAKACSPLRTVVTAQSLAEESAGLAARTHQHHQLHGIKPAMLRVNTSGPQLATRTTSASHSEGGSADHSPLNMSPASAPLLSHVPSLTMGMGAPQMHSTGDNAAAAVAAAAAAAFVAHATAAQQQQVMAGMSVNPAVTLGNVIDMSAMTGVTAAPGGWDEQKSMPNYIPQAGVANQSAGLSGISYNQFSQVLSAVTSAASMPIVTSANLSDAPLSTLSLNAQQQQHHQQLDRNMS